MDQKLSEILESRGYVYQTSAESVAEITDGPKRTLYLGIDPTADSMHVGHLLGLLVLRHFLEHGHTIILLTGGGTGMIGDPGGKSEERNLLDTETIAHNTKAVADQIRTVFGSSDFIEVDNAAWLTDLKLLEFLRDIGKYYTVNAMIKKDTVRTRLEAESPMSFTEFSYALLQGYDFLHLNEQYGCDVQVGGSDQWSNILTGVEFIRRKAEKTVYALTWPLLINKSTGKKFGKSEDGAIWLDPKKTSPFQFYQFWLNSEDEAVEEYLKKMTLLRLDEIEATMNAHRVNLGDRIAQKKLAEAVTTLVHGKETTAEVARVTEVLFGDGGLDSLIDTERDLVRTSAPTTEVTIGESFIDVLVKSGLATSKREAREFVENGAITLNGMKVMDQNRVILLDDFLSSSLALLKRGKRTVSVLIRS